MTIRLDHIKGQKIGIFGLGLTGVSVYKSLIDTAGQVICYDDLENTRRQFAAQFGEKALLPITDNNWIRLNQIIVSPGISRSHAVFALAEQYNIAISSDIELFYHQNPNSKYTVITGTNGKSTTTALTSHILASSGINYAAGGNIGTPVLSLPAGKEHYLFELSSFQIDLLTDFIPNIAVLLNITPNHLDRHGNFEEYARIKASILMRGGIRIITVDSQVTAEIYQKLKKLGEKELIPISSINEIKEGVSLFENRLIDNFFDHKQYILPINPNLVGRHNQENIVASFVVCRALGVKGKEIIGSIASFQGLAHRMQYIASKDGIDFYNDSKATNATAALAALSSLDNIFWLAGGRFKEENLLPLNNVLDNIRKAYIFGESKHIFADYLKDKVDYEISDTMQEAFNLAVRDAKAYKGKKNILLAPAAASLDQFKNFEERGRIFKELVESLPDNI